MTHLGSNWQELVKKINCNPDIECFHTGNTYSHFEDIRRLTKQPHKKGNSESIWADVVLHNKDLASKEICRCCKMLFWSNDFDPNHPELKELGNRAHDYYEIRLEGMRQYQKRTRGLWNPSLDDLSF